MLKNQNLRSEITENQLAEYECRDGSKAVCYGVPFEDRYTAIDENGLFCSIFGKDGRANRHAERPYDLIRKIRDL